MNKKGMMVAAMAGATAVVFGAFGAHALKDLLSPESLAVWKTGVQYQFYHTFAILAAALSVKYIGHRSSNIITRLFQFGIILFSGSLYLLSTRELTGLPWISVLGPITPIGGLFFIAGWISMGWFFIKSKITDR